MNGNNLIDAVNAGNFRIIPWEMSLRLAAGIIGLVELIWRRNFAPLWGIPVFIAVVLVISPYKLLVTELLKPLYIKYGGRNKPAIVKTLLIFEALNDKIFGVLAIWIVTYVIFTVSKKDPEIHYLPFWSFACSYPFWLCITSDTTEQKVDFSVMRFSEIAYLIFVCLLNLGDPKIVTAIVLAVSAVVTFIYGELTFRKTYFRQTMKEALEIAERRNAAARINASQSKKAPKSGLYRQGTPHRHVDFHKKRGRR